MTFTYSFTALVFLLYEKMSQLKISLSSLTEIKPVGKKKPLEIKKADACWHQLFCCGSLVV